MGISELSSDLHTERSTGLMSTKETNPCPVCGLAQLEYMEICPFCDWQNDPVQIRHPDWDGCANKMSLNQAKEAYQAGRPIQ